MNLQQLREAVALLGGQTSTAAHLGLGGPYYLNRVLAGSRPIPRRWGERLATALNNHSKGSAELVARIRGGVD